MMFLKIAYLCIKITPLAGHRLHGHSYAFGRGGCVYTHFATDASLCKPRPKAFFIYPNHG